MSARLTHDVVATVGEYTDRETGQKKKRYHTCGKCFTDEEGRQSLKIDAMPVAGWSGWLSLYPIEKQQPRPAPRPAAAAASPASRPPAAEDPDEDIPF